MTIGQNRRSLPLYNSGSWRGFLSFLLCSANWEQEATKQFPFDWRWFSNRIARWGVVFNIGGCFNFHIGVPCELDGFRTQINTYNSWGLQSYPDYSLSSNVLTYFSLDCSLFQIFWLFSNSSVSIIKHSLGLSLPAESCYFAVPFDRYQKVLQWQ